MTHASLFSGIGGFDLAAEWAGWTNVFNCEIDPFCRKVLKYHFPNAEQYDDIRTIDFTVWRDRIDVLTGGFPCQPFSVAGKRRGTGDDRYLWPEMLGSVREIRPRWVVGENVLGIVDWSGGLVFEQVCSDMEDEGYEVRPFVLPACGVDAPHLRYRTFIVAHRADSGSEDMCRREDGIHAVGVSADTCGIGLRERAYEQEFVERRVRSADTRACSENGAPAYADSERRKERFTPAESGQKRWRNGENGYAERRIPDWSGFPTESPVCCRDDGFPGGLDGITFPKWCRESVKAYGNAIVPQVACQMKLSAWDG